MVKACKVIALVLVCASLMSARNSSPAFTEKSPRVFSIGATNLQALRDRIRNNREKDPAIEKLRSRANKALDMQPVSVMQKNAIPPSGDKHDYLSLARYWWPDPTKPHGLPYMRRDGEVNPEIRQVEDKNHLDEMITATSRLSLAYYLFGDEKYAAQAAKLMRAWFLDPTTRMNPNMNHAQLTRGRNIGRGSGLIDSRRLSNVVDTIGLLASSKSWTAEDQSGMEKWFRDYLKWLRNSDNGRDESQAENNHGSFYDVQVASIALFTGDVDLATKVLKRETNRIAYQIDKDGGQPRELDRTRSLWYSTFNLTALFQLARLGESVGVDLWSFQTKDGRSIRKALDYLTPYVTGEKKWPYKQIDEYKSDAIVPVYLEAAVKYKNPEYEKIARQLHPGAWDDIGWVLESQAD